MFFPRKNALVAMFAFFFPCMCLTQVSFGAEGILTGIDIEADSEIEAEKENIIEDAHVLTENPHEMLSESDLFVDGEEIDSSAVETSWEVFSSNSDMADSDDNNIKESAKDSLAVEEDIVFVDGVDQNLDTSLINQQSTNSDDIILFEIISDSEVTTYDHEEPLDIFSGADLDISDELITNPVGALIDSGSDGGSVTWALDSNGTLTISGTGPISGYWFPWGTWSGEKTVYKVVISEGISNIGERCFHGMQGINSITLPSSLISIESEAFILTSNLKSLIIPKGVTYLGSECFSNAGIEQINLNDGLKSIGRACFCYSKLKEIILPDSVTDLGESFCAYCDELVKASIDGAVLEIPRNAFYCSRNLKDVILNEGTKRIEENAFWCENLESINIPKSVEFIHDSAFIPSSNLTMHVYHNTYGEKYAKEKGFKFEYIDEDPVINSKLHVIMINGAEADNLQSAAYFASSIHGKYLNGYQIDSYIVKDSPTHVELSNIIDKYESISTEEDITLFYYGGHGNGIHQAPVPGIAMGPLQGFYSFPDLYRDLSKIHGKLFVIMDCCYSGAFIKLNDIDSNKFYVITVTTDDVPGTMTNQYSWIGRNIFGKQLMLTLLFQEIEDGLGLNGKKAKADYNSDGCVTNFELFYYISSGKKLRREYADNVDTNGNTIISVPQSYGKALFYFSNDASLTPISALPVFTLDKPTNLKVSLSNSSLLLSWKLVPRAKYYKIYRTLNGKTELIGTTTKSIFYDKRIINGQSYKYQVQASEYTTNDVIYKDSKKSNSVNFTFLNVPGNLKVKSTKTKTVTASWKKNAKATGYQIQYSLKSSMASAKTVTISKAATVKRVIKNLKKGKTYYFQIRSYKKVSGKNYYSIWSGKKKVKVK